ncbi:hypothetical protein G9O61_00g002600, partial [Vairimorpha ceranae]
MLKKISESLNKKDIDGLLTFLMDIDNLVINKDLIDLLNSFYEKEKEISNVVLSLNTLKNEKCMKRKSK